jgi:hypothetical protein
MITAVGARISFPLNLYVHLEVGSGSPPIYFSRTYLECVSQLLPPPLRQSFNALAKGYDFSLTMRLAASRARTVEDITPLIPGSMTGTQRWHDLLEEASQRYQEFWDREARPSLETFLGKASTRFDQVLEGARLVPELTGHGWEVSELCILPVYAVSEMFGFGGQPLGEECVIVGPAEPDLFVVGVLHEVVHLNLGKGVGKVARTHGYEPDVFTESVANMVTGTLIHRVGLEPPSDTHGPDTTEYRSFLDKFEEYNEILRPLWSHHLDAVREHETTDTIDHWLDTNLPHHN